MDFNLFSLMELNFSLSETQQLLLLSAMAVCLVLGVMIGWRSGTVRFRTNMSTQEVNLQKVEEANETLKVEKNLLDSDKQMILAEVERLSGERAGFEERASQLQERLKELQENQGSKLAEQVQTVIEKMQVAQSQNATVPDAEMGEFMGQIAEQFSAFETQLQQLSHERTAQQASIEKMLESLSAHTGQSATGNTAVLEGLGTAQDWGSAILERLFAASGLSDANLCERLPSKNGSSSAEWVVSLPDNKSLIVDGLCPLENWHRFINLPEGDTKESAGAAFVADVKARMELLASQDFSEEASVGEVEFSFLFIPPDAGWMYLLNREPELVNEAQQKRITLVSTSNLMLSLKLVEHLWHVKQENHNSERIVDRAHRLYKKWLAFAQEMHRLGGSLQKANSEYDKAMQRLSTGRGNLVRQTEELIDLGVPRPPGKLPESVAVGMLSRELDDEVEIQAEDQPAEEVAEDLEGEAVVQSMSS